MPLSSPTAPPSSSLYYSLPCLEGTDLLIVYIWLTEQEFVVLPFHYSYFVLFHESLGGWWWWWWCEYGVWLWEEVWDTFLPSTVVVFGDSIYANHIDMGLDAKESDSLRIFMYANRVLEHCCWRFLQYCSVCRLTAYTLSNKKPPLKIKMKMFVTITCN